MRMKIGVCANYDKAAEAKEAGFDYLEPPAKNLSELREEDFERMKRSLEETGIPCPRFNVLFPGEMSLYQEGVGEELRRYLETVLGRVRTLGGEIVVFGSGKSRMRPENLSYGDAFRCLTEKVRIMGEVAEKYGIAIAIEPLNRKETNMINSVAEGADLAAAVNHPAVRLLADYYHMAVEGEKVSEIIRVGGVVHAHVAEPAGRKYPTEETPELRDFMKAVATSAFPGMVSVEGHTEDLSLDGPAALKALRRMMPD